MEVVGALLVTAALGALVLTHRGRLTPRSGSASAPSAALRAGGHPASLPAPGVYARHNAMDVPALDPDGTPLESSVPRVLRVRGQEADAASTPRASTGCSRAAGPSAPGTSRRDEHDTAAGSPTPSRARSTHPRDRDAAAAEDARHRTGGRPVSLTHYLVLAAILFAIGATTVLLRRNAIIVFMGVELMLNSTNLLLVTFSRMHGNLSGQVLAFFVMVVAAAEVVVGLAIIVSIFRTRRSASVDDVNLLKS